MILDTARLMLFPALMAFAAASDIFTMSIPNRVSLALAAGFLVLAVASGMGTYDILMHVAAGATVLVIAFACFAIGQVGGGDAKIAAAAALWAADACLVARHIRFSRLGILYQIDHFWAVTPNSASYCGMQNLSSPPYCDHAVQLANSKPQSTRTCRECFFMKVVPYLKVRPENR